MRWIVFAYVCCIGWGGLFNLSAQGNLHSMVLEARTEVECTSATQYVSKNSLIITVFDRMGEQDAAFVCFCDKYVSLNNFSGEILDLKGNRVRKIRKSDLQVSEYSSSLLTDDYRYYFICNYPSFPYTVKYEWEEKCRNGVIGFPTFMPQTSFNQLVKKAFYSIKLPVSQSCRYYAKNLDNRNVDIRDEVTADGKQQIQVIATDLPPLNKEPLSPSWSDLLPMVYFAPSAFEFDKVKGNLDTWRNYGLWLYQLQTDRDVLDESVKQRLHELVSGCNTEREKVKAVYDFLAATTRYVSIQLGIGGLQPAAAAEVSQLGFGDCKGLTNYMRAMLKELGIPSTYAVVSTERARLIPDFSSANQMNHVVLQVPLPNDTLWLECTNPQLPFGYVHRSIAGHDALLVESSGGRLCRIPDYPDSLNRQIVCAKIRILPAGDAVIRVREGAWLGQYEENAAIASMNPDRQEQLIRSRVGLSRVQVTDWHVEEQKKAFPSLKLTYELNVGKYGSKTGNRLFVPVNVFRDVPDFSLRHERTQPIYVEQGYMDADTLYISFPDEYEMEFVPSSTSLSSQFGEFSSQVSAEHNELRVIHRLVVHKGFYPSDVYADFLRFWKHVTEQYKSKFVLLKKPL
ncbi:transglutaminase-like domain-containing protein [uncultured Bacteroides sp.]|uniref:transglutaminase-like domain-containing protein n=1 Tax=uncultured Bacteroides sp. TaxID=162156 RepID=UPI00260EEC9C|nr:transglutaminase-like domain-containing protein [uncultured Bacteroides sp.]